MGILRMDGQGPFDDLEGNYAFGRLFQKFLAKFGSVLLQNNEYLQAQNAAGTGFINLLKGDASNNTILNALTGKKTSLTVNDAEIGKIDANGITASHFLLTDGSDKNYSLAIYAAGTAYQLTAVSTALAFGTTSPALTIDKAGTYLLTGRANIKYNGATFAASRTVDLKLRRTNNTAADITNTLITGATDVVTTKTFTFGVLNTPQVLYTANAGDIISLFGDVSVIPTVGSLDVVEASIVALRLY